jgi:hypothetical protein
MTLSAALSTATDAGTADIIPMAQCSHVEARQGSLIELEHKPPLDGMSGGE